jgi:hypothetical protein
LTVQPGEGRVMTVFIAQGWMRWPLRCRARELADYGWNVREPRTEGDQTPARMPCEARKRDAWACPAKRAGAKQGRADGSSACPGGSPSEPGGVSTKATIPGDMQQTGQIHPRAERRRKTASVAGPASPLDQPACWPGESRCMREPVCRLRERHAGARITRCGRHGRGFSPGGSARPSLGDKEQRDRRTPSRR